jgi:hypothetical protein
MVSMNRAETSNLQNLQISIAPNPSTGLFNLKLNKNVSNLFVEVTNINGKKIHVHLVQIDEYHSLLDLKEESNGIYFLKIMGTNFSKFEKITKY